MPFLQIFTNLTRKEIPEKFGPMVAEVLSKAMRNKTIGQITVQVSPDQYLSSGSVDSDRIALVILHSIGSMDPGDNRETIKALTQFIQTKLKIEPDNVRMAFQSYSTDMVGTSGKIVSDMK